MNCLVTGGAGFIGSNIVKKLLKKGAKVSVLDDLSVGKAENIDNAAEFINGNINDLTLLNKISFQYDAIFHLAAFTSVPESFKNENKCRLVNEKGVENIIDYSVKNNVKKIIFSSTSAVYSDHDSRSLNEKSLTSPSSPYGSSKLKGEHLLNRWTLDNKDRSGIVLRYFNVFGPGQEAESDYASVIPKFLYRIINKSPIIIYGDGTQTRDYIYIDDIVSANIKSLNFNNFNTFVVGTGKDISINSLVDKIKNIINKEVKIDYAPLPDGDALKSLSDSSKLIHEGWEQKVNIDSGLIKTWEFFLREDSK